MNHHNGTLRAVSLNGTISNWASPILSRLLRLFQLLSITQLHFFGTKDVSLFLNLSNLPYKQFEVLPTKIF